MICVMPYSRWDANLAFYAADVLLRKTNIPKDKLILYGGEGAPDVPKGMGLMYIKSMNDADTHPLGPNIMFAGLMKIAQKKFREPLFLCEADGFPTTPDWYERVKAAHEATGMMVSGSLVDWVKPVHFNGNLVIDTRIVKKYPWLARQVVMAWDCFHSEILMGNGADNGEILNARRTFRSYPTDWWFNLKKNGKTPAWIHGCQNFQCWERIDKDGF